MSETHEIRLKRLYMRSIRRGIKEMDVILEHFAKANLDKLSPQDLDLYEALLGENDQDLYLWVSGQQQEPVYFQPIVATIKAQSHFPD